jgi:hypothetical protein
MNKAKEIELRLLTSLNKSGFDPNQPRDWQGRWTDTYENRPCFKEWFEGSEVKDEDGDPVTVYHGTTHDFTEFKDERANVENNFGAGHYASTSLDDVENNYAKIGADLDYRIEKYADILTNDGEMDYDEAKAVATKTLYGGQDKVIELFVSMKTPFVFGVSYNNIDVEETIFELKLSEDGYDYEGSLVDFMDNVRRAGAQYYDFDYDKVVDDIYSEFLDIGFISASNLMVMLRQSEGLIYAVDEWTGDFASAEILRKAIELSGFDGIIDNTVSQKFRFMNGVYRDTAHIIAFDPGQYKSVDAESYCHDSHIYKRHKNDK